MYPPVEPPPGIYYDRFLWVKFQDDLDIGLSPEGIPIDRSGGGISGPQGQAVMEYIRAQGGRWERMIAVSEARADEWRMNAAFNGKTTADLNTYFHLWVGEEASAQDWLERLAELTQVEKLGRVPIPSLPTPPNYDSLQRYMKVVYPEDTAYSTAKSIEADYAWKFLGGHGQGVTICDIELDWNFDHGEIPQCIPVWIPSNFCWYHDANSDASFHGTSNLGLIASKLDSFGTTGISQRVKLAVAPAMIGPTGQCGNYFMLGTVMSVVIDSLEAGDIIVLELQTGGIDVIDSLIVAIEQAPIEVYPPAYALVKVAVGNGIHVVAAAGNGGHNLGTDSVDVNSIFSDPSKWSGAIIVGAGSPGPNVLDSLFDYGTGIYYDDFYDNTLSRSRQLHWGSSCYGPPDTGNGQRRVDVQAWGALVTAPGYPEYYTQDGINYYYSRWYQGTSSATPIVAGAVAIMEGMWEARHQGQPMPPDSMRALLRNTGLPQQGNDSLTHPIGPLVNVRLAIEAAFGSLTPCCTGKRGNANGDTLGVVDLSDLSVLIGYLDDTCQAVLPCPSAADVDGDGLITNSDVTVLVYYLIFNIDNRVNCSLGRGVTIPGRKGGKHEGGNIYCAASGSSEHRRYDYPSAV